MNDREVTMITYFKKNIYVIDLRQSGLAGGSRWGTESFPNVPVAAVGQRVPGHVAPAASGAAALVL